MRLKKVLVAMISLVFFIFAVFLIKPVLITHEQEYRAFISPDGKYRIVVFRAGIIFPAVMPGQSGDSSGTVKLYDQNGNVLRESKVEMVQLVDQVDWESHKVSVKLVADWDLISE